MPARAVSWSSISRRTSITTTASGCRSPAGGARFSIPIPRITAAAMSATSAKSRPLHGLVPELSLTIPPLAAIFLVPEELKHATVCRNVLTPRCNLGRPGHQFCAVLRQRAKGRALPVRQPGPPRARTHRAARAHRGRLARLSQRRVARAALRLSRSWALRARTRPSLQSPTSCCSIPMPGVWPDGWSGAMRISPIAPAARARICRSTGATTPAACRRRSSSTRPSTGDAARPRPNVAWEDTIIYEAHVKGLTQQARRRAAAICAAPMAACPRPP